MKLNVIKNKQHQKSIDLSTEVEGIGSSEAIFIIGRSANALIQLDDKQISREHAKLIYQNKKWTIECLGENKVLVNSQRVAQVELKNGDEITVGPFILEIDIQKNDEDNSKIFHFDFANKQESSSSKSDLTKSEISFEQVSKSETSKPDKSQIIKEVSSKSDDLDFDLNIDEAQKPVETKKEEQALENSESEAPGDFLLDFDGEKPVVAEAQAESEFQDESMNDNLDFADLSSGDNQSEGFSDSSGENEDALSVVDNGDEAYSLDSLDDTNEDGTRVIQAFASIELILFGESAPYDRYRLEDGETFIGRDPKKCQIVLNDSEVSGVHAVIRKSNISCVLEDLNSSNGTLVNGERVNRVNLNNNDEFLIGGVSFTVKYRSEFLKQENQTLMPVETNETVEVEEVVEIPAEEGDSFDALGGEIAQAPQEKSIIKRIWKDDKQRKKLIYGIVIAGLAYTFLAPEGDDSEKKPQVVKKEQPKKEVIDPNKKVLTPEQREQLSRYYQFGRKHFLEGRYREAIEEFEKIIKVDPNFNDNVASQLALAKEGLRKIEENERKKQQELEEAERKKRVEELLQEAREFVKDRRIELAESRFSEIALIDPDNIEVPRLKLDIENWKKDIARKELEEAQKKAERSAKVQKLQPGKTLFSQKEWFKAVAELEKFLKIEDMDDDLRKEGETMYDTAKSELTSTVNPLLGKARSLVEGQDLKGAYETYYQILKIDPSNAEALNQTTDIKDQLTNKARKIYREAIISESLSLFQDAKEKFQEVQQISPVDSEYYKKATEKLKNYLE